MRERRRLDAATANWLLLITLATYLAGSAVGARLIDNFALQILVVQMCVLAPTIVFCLFLQPKGERHATIRDDLCIRPVKISTVLLVAVTMLFLSPLLTFVNLLSQLLSNYVAAESIVEEISGSPFWVAFAVIAVLPAVTEEFVYRGMLFGGCRKRSILMGAIVSGLVFGLMHGNLNQLMYAFVMGVVFALIDEITGSTVSSMVMHLLVNGTSVVLVYLMADMQNRPGKIGEMMAEAAQETEKVGWADLGPFAVLAAIGTFVAYKLMKVLALRCGTSEKMREELHKPDRLTALRELITAPLVVTVAILAALIVVVEIWG